MNRRKEASMRRWLLLAVASVLCAGSFCSASGAGGASTAAESSKVHASGFLPSRLGLLPVWFAGDRGRVVSVGPVCSGPSSDVAAMLESGSALVLGAARRRAFCLDPLVHHPFPEGLSMIRRLGGRVVLISAEGRIAWAPVGRNLPAGCLPEPWWWKDVTARALWRPLSLPGGGRLAQWAPCDEGIALLLERADGSQRLFMLARAEGDSPFEPAEEVLPESARSGWTVQAFPRPRGGWEFFVGRGRSLFGVASSGAGRKVGRIVWKRVDYRGGGERIRPLFPGRWPPVFSLGGGVVLARWNGRWTVLRAPEPGVHQEITPAGAAGSGMLWVVRDVRGRFRGAWWYSARRDEWKRLEWASGGSEPLEVFDRGGEPCFLCLDSVVRDLDGTPVALVEGGVRRGAGVLHSSGDECWLWTVSGVRLLDLTRGSCSRAAFAARSSLVTAPVMDVYVGGSGVVCLLGENGGWVVSRREASDAVRARRLLAYHGRPTAVAAWSTGGLLMAAANRIYAFSLPGGRREFFAGPFPARSPLDEIFFVSRLGGRVLFADRRRVGVVSNGGEPQELLRLGGGRGYVRGVSQLGRDVYVLCSDGGLYVISLDSLEVQCFSRIAEAPDLSPAGVEVLDGMLCIPLAGAHGVMLGVLDPAPLEGGRAMPRMQRAFCVLPCAPARLKAPARLWKATDGAGGRMLVLLVRDCLCTFPWAGKTVGREGAVVLARPGLKAYVSGAGLALCWGGRAWFLRAGKRPPR